MRQTPTSPVPAPILSHKKQSTGKLPNTLIGIGNGGGDGIGREHNRYLYSYPNEQSNPRKAHSK